MEKGGNSQQSYAQSMLSRFSCVAATNAPSSHIPSSFSTQPGKFASGTTPSLRIHRTKRCLSAVTRGEDGHDKTCE